MFRKKPSYNDLIEILALIDAETINRHENIKELRRARAEDIDYLSKRIDRAYAGFETLNKRLTALEDKLQPKKQTKKQTKKTKGK